MCQSSISSSSSCTLPSYIIFLFLYRSLCKSLAVNCNARWARTKGLQVVSPVTTLLYPPSTYKGSFSRIKGIHSVKDYCSPAFHPLHCWPLCVLQFILSLFLNKQYETQSLLNWSHGDQDSTLPLGNPKIAPYIAQSWVTRPQFTPSCTFSRYFFLFVFIILSLSSNCLLLPLFFYSCLFLPPFSIPSPVSFRVFLHNPSRFYFFFLSSFLGAFAYYRKTPIHVRPSVCPVCLSVCVSVRMHQRGSHWTDFREVLCWGLLRRSIGKLHIWWKLDKNIGHFTWRPKYVSFLPVTHIRHRSGFVQHSSLLVLRVTYSSTFL